MGLYWSTANAFMFAFVCLVLFLCLLFAVCWICVMTWLVSVVQVSMVCWRGVGNRFESVRSVGGRVCMGYGSYVELCLFVYCLRHVSGEKDRPEQEESTKIAGNG